MLDLPGGMRIGTIHAFSQSLLRRFPLEAAISPHFQLVDDRDADDALTEAREDMLPVPALRRCSTPCGRWQACASAETFGGHVKTLQIGPAAAAGGAELGADLERAQRRALG